MAWTSHAPLTGLCILEERRTFCKRENGQDKPYVSGSVQSAQLLVQLCKSNIFIKPRKIVQSPMNLRDNRILVVGGVGVKRVVAVLKEVAV
jgi:hypothetical protein